MAVFAAIRHLIRPDPTLLVDDRQNNTIRAKETALCRPLSETTCRMYLPCIPNRSTLQIAHQNQQPYSQFVKKQPPNVSMYRYRVPVRENTCALKPSLPTRLPRVTWNMPPHPSYMPSTWILRNVSNPRHCLLDNLCWCSYWRRDKKELCLQPNRRQLLTTAKYPGFAYRYRYGTHARHQPGNVVSSRSLVTIPTIP